MGDVREQSLKDIWHSSKMNALRRQHLEGKRCQNPVCSKCGQLSHCLPDNIDQYREGLLPKFLEYAARVENAQPPGTESKKIIPITLL